MALLASAGLNLLLAALLFGPPAMAQLGGADRASPQAVVQAMASRLPAADATILRAAFARSAPDLARMAERRRQTHEALTATLTDARFDVATFERQMDESRTQRQAMTALMADMLRQALEAMSPDGRAAFARNFKSGRSG